MSEIMSELFGVTPTLIGVCHLAPLPGAPRFGGEIGSVIEGAVSDARALAEGGARAVIVENFGDAPFHGGAVPAETVAGLTLAVHAVRDAVGSLPVGVNVLRNDVRAALGICAATGARFVRVNVHTGVAATDQGLIEGRADETLRERARLCPSVAILADVHVKHATPVGSESIEDAARETLGRGLADAVILTGSATGSAPAPGDVACVREGIGAGRILIGAGLTAEDAGLLRHADGAIVGTWLKRGGRIDGPVDPARVRKLREGMDALAASETRGGGDLPNPGGSR
ncbi:MAG: phosphorybosylanthranilate isomerase [Planctomycetes bacterium]|nr:phosphorybosylanthranilate isomerase [Planctomycetota bacterium]